MPMSKYLTDSEIRQMVSESDAEIDRRAQKRFDAERLIKIQAYIDAHPEEIANDPMVKALRALPMRGASPVTPSALPVGRPPTRAELERAKPWLRPRKPEVQSVIDPYAGPRIN
jgi:hypothetical protein